MLVKELIEKLQKVENQEAEIVIWDDGDIRCIHEIDSEWQFCEGHERVDINLEIG